MFHTKHTIYWLSIGMVVVAIGILTMVTAQKYAAQYAEGGKDTASVRHPLGKGVGNSAGLAAEVGVSAGSGSGNSSSAGATSHSAAPHSTASGGSSAVSTASPPPVPSPSPSPSPTPAPSPPAPSPSPPPPPPPAPSPSPPPPTPPPPPSEIASETDCPGQASTANAAAVLACMASYARTYNGIAAISSNSSLVEAAEAKVQDMVNCGFSHTACGRPFDYWFSVKGYPGNCHGENLGQGQGSIRQVFIAWMNSSAHRANILSSTFQHIGAAFGTGSSGNLWAMELGGC